MGIKSPYEVNSLLDLPNVDENGNDVSGGGTSGGSTGTDPGSSTGGDSVDTTWLIKIGEFIWHLGGLIHPSIQHMPWDTANANAISFATQMQNSVKAKFPDPVIVEKIGEQYRKNMIRLINDVRATRWGEGYPENTQVFQDAMVRLGGGDPKGKIYVVSWFWAMWSLRNSDMSNPDEWTKMTVNDMNATLFPAIETVTGVKIPRTTVNVTPAGSNGSSITLGGSLSSTVSSIFGGLGVGSDIAVVGIIILVIFFIWKGLGK